MKVLQLEVGQTYLSESNVVVTIEGTDGKFGSEKYRGSNNRVYNEDGSESRPFKIGASINRPKDNLIKIYDPLDPSEPMVTTAEHASLPTSVKLEKNKNYLTDDNRFVTIISSHQNLLTSDSFFKGSDGRTYLPNGQEWRPAGTSDGSPLQTLVREEPVVRSLNDKLESPGEQLKIEVNKSYCTAQGVRITIKQCHVMSVNPSAHVVVFQGVNQRGSLHYYTEHGKALSGYSANGPYPIDDLVVEIIDLRQK